MGNDLIEFAYSDAALTTDETQRCLHAIAADGVTTRRRARLFALARRLSTNQLAALWDVVRPDERTLVLRAIAGRARTLNSVAPPGSWNIDLRSDLAAATIVQRFNLVLETQPEDPLAAVSGLGQSSLQQQLATARWVRGIRWTPTIDDLSIVTPYTTPSLVRSLAEGPVSTTVDWTGWISFVARRARLAPRLWGNAWRALRDGVPKAQWTTNNVGAWSSLIDALPRVRTLDGETLAWFECEDAAALDRWNNALNRTPRCASGPTRWISQALSARVLGALRGQEAERATELERIRREAQGRAQVLIEVASASCTLGRGAAIALLTRLAAERDPGVLAALLEGLVEHPALFSALSPALRESLVRAPFDAPEATMLEARVHATKLARSMGREELVRAASASTVRALRLSADPEAGVRGTVTADPTMTAQGGVARVRWVTDAGSFELELEREAAPRAVEHLLSMVAQRRYDGLRFHRVVPGVVAQGGDPRGDGYGGMETPIVTELSLRSFERGAVGVPLAGLDTGGMQVFIVLADAPHLDGRYPWIGRVTQGIESVDGLLPGDRIVRVERSQ